MLLTKAGPIALTPEKKEHPEQDVDRWEQQNDQSASWKTEATTARQMNEEHSVENGQYDCCPTNNLPEHVAEIGTQRSARSGDTDYCDGGNEKENDAAQPCEPA